MDEGACGARGVSDDRPFAVAGDGSTPEPGPKKCRGVHDVVHVLDAHRIAGQAREPCRVLLVGAYVHGDSGLRVCLDNGING